MALELATRIGAYEITGEIGAGGMGVVYRATDTTLGREVAIKTLPEALAADADRLARFEREAKLLAALNHPNIAVIYGLEESNGTRCIAMELIEGQTLEERLEDGSLSVDDALRLALQIAQALEAAHDKGVVHRDLKPANVMITKDGLVKVLDFGLAKAFGDDAGQSELGQSPALSLAMTQQGIVLGTASYMSPEQASGQATDQRADVWAFGVVLFEMLSGLPLFSGESVPHILADVLKTEPDWNRLPKNLHPRLRLLLERCLTKKPRDRYHAIADARIEIEAVLNDPEGTAATAVESAAARPRPVLPWVAATAVVTAAVVGAIAWLLRPAPEPPPVNRFSYLLPEGTEFRGTGRSVIALSADGRQLAYNAVDGIHVRPMGELVSRLIAGTEPLSVSPTFSPDGQSIAYHDLASAELKRVGVNGGAPVLVGELANFVNGLSWEADGNLWFGLQDGVYRVPASGGSPELVIPSDANAVAHGPRLLPDGDHVLFTNGVDNWNSGAQIVAQSLSTGERTVLVEGGGDARYVPTGHLVYALDSNLFAVAFDLATMTVSRGAVPVVQGVMRSTNAQTATGNFEIADDGTLLYVSGQEIDTRNTLTWVDRSGRREALGAPPRSYTYPKISPDGTRVALDVRDQELDIWIWDLVRENLRRLTFDAGEDEFPTWSPDSRTIAFSSSRGGGSGNNTNLYRRAADGTGSAELLAEFDGQIFPSSYLPDASGVLVRTTPSGNNDDISVVQLND
ncbi:MAG TPA: protein kinase, partial [Gammaproteobacteria bacterium]